MKRSVSSFPIGVSLLLKRLLNEGVLYLSLSASKNCLDEFAPYFDFNFYILYTILQFCWSFLVY